jgi:predicted amidohydrolase YtcJ
MTLLRSTPHQADRGTLKPGKLADFVILDADPRPNSGILIRSGRW